MRLVKYVSVDINQTILYNTQPLHYTHVTAHKLQTTIGLLCLTMLPLLQWLGVSVEYRLQVLQIIVFRSQQLLDNRKPRIFLYIYKHTIYIILRHYTLYYTTHMDTGVVNTVIDPCIQCIVELMEDG